LQTKWHCRYKTKHKGNNARSKYAEMNFANKWVLNLECRSEIYMESAIVCNLPMNTSTRFQVLLWFSQKAFCIWSYHVLQYQCSTLKLLKSQMKHMCTNKSNSIASARLKEHNRVKSKLAWCQDTSYTSMFEFQH
jgi:hypothetical protein